MKMFKIEVSRTYTTEVYVKCEEKETVEDVLNASPPHPSSSLTQEMMWDTQTNLWDHIFDEEMEQCNITEQYTTVDESYKTGRIKIIDLDKQLKN